MTITYEPPWGRTFDAAVDTAKALAEAGGEPVRLIFNAVPFTVSANTSASALRPLAGSYARALDRPADGSARYNPLAG